MGVSYMNIKKLFYLTKINIAKLVMLSCIFLFAFFFVGNKTNAATITIKSSTYSGNAENTSPREFNGITYIQGSGISNEDGITFEMTNVYTDITDITAFAVWESAFSSSSINPDYDRWYIRAYDCSLDACAIKDGFDNFEKNLEDNLDVVRYPNGHQDKGKIIYTQVSNIRYYIERESALDYVGTPPAKYIQTDVDFTQFFSNKKITYTYRIRNANYVNRQDGFGYKEIYVNYWKATDGDDATNPSSSQTIEFGLARAISDVESYTNYNYPHSTSSPITCSDNADKICVDYVDTNGDPSKSTTVPKTTNIYLPSNIIYNHESTTKTNVKDNYKNGSPDMEYVAQHNTTYALNYFCESLYDGITHPTITYSNNEHSVSECATGSLRKYLYVEAGNDADITDLDLSDVDPNTLVSRTHFMDNPYHVTLTVDARGSYVLVIRDAFGNTNELAVIKVTDIINQALLVYFEKSNKTGETVLEPDGWKANEYLTNEDVETTLTMTATTVIEQGLPIIGAETTSLNAEYVKTVQYWRVDTSGDNYTKDVCEEGVKTGCAEKPNSGVIDLYNSTGNGTPTTHESFVSFVENKLTVALPSNGRYRFYIETFPGNKSSENEGETKNPRVEIYKIDKEKPEILFGGSTGSNCDQSGCEYNEETFKYYQGSGKQNGSIIDNTLKNNNGEIIVYQKDGIYYVNANPSEDPNVNKNPILGSAATREDEFFTYLYALYNSGAFIKENLNYYSSGPANYSYFRATSTSDTEYVLTATASAMKELNETAYREYIIKNGIKYTAYSLASNDQVTLKNDQPTYQQNRIKIEYLDKESTNTKICDKLNGIFQDTDFNGDNVFDQNDCVNYYLDHSLDFIIKITAYDVIQDAQGKYILGNSSTREITVNVKDTTAPGYNKQILRYNVGTECRIELGNPIGLGGQSVDNLFDCYGIYTDSAYNFEDNTFQGYTQNQTVNTKEHVDMYILSKEDETWVSLKDDSYIPNRSGKYAILTIIRDDASEVTTTFNFAGQTYHDVTIANGHSISVSGNAIANITTYHVDKKIVVIAPESNAKTYGESDPVFNYSVYINKNTTGIAEFLQAPFADMTKFTLIGTTTVDNNVASLTEEQLKEIFKGNYGIVDFSGTLTRQESGTYNANHGKSGTNNYVGLYKIVLGSLNITGEADDNYDLGNDYIVKVDPRVRSGEHQLVALGGYRGTSKCNLVNSQKFEGETVSDCYGYEDDDDFYVESSVTFMIKQATLTVTATGASKEYGTQDPNYRRYAMNTGVTDDYQTETAGYLNGFSVTGLKDSGGYNDTAKIVLGVLRREVGENVGTYAICNYRGTDNEDNVFESTINMLVVGKSNKAAAVNCSEFDDYASVTINTSAYDERGIIIGGSTDEEKTIYENYIKSRALYVETNKKVADIKTLNTTTDYRNNNYANYVIGYTESVLTITPATLIVQPAPGQRREYNYSGVDEVNPWEILVFGEKEFNVSDDNRFNGYTEKNPTYTNGENDPQSLDKGQAGSGEEYYNNASEVRASWKLVKDGKLYSNGKKTNETYSLLEGRLSLKNKTPTDGKYLNMSAGWYEFNALADSTLGVKINDRAQCSYADYQTEVGITKDGSCRNYDLILDLDYRNDDGYKNGDIVNGDTLTVVYKSKGLYCKTTTLGDVSDVDLQCSNEQSSKILFEVYRREIILEFNSLLEANPFNANEKFVYGNEYDYYKDNVFAINADNNDLVEDRLFYCYGSVDDGIVGVSGGCTTNKWYGLTEGDSWVNLGLTFRLHSAVNSHSGALSAGRYYVYASISNTNYKFNYQGGTLTIKTRAVNITINSYTKEYGNVYFSDVTCLKDGYILNASDDLMSGCAEEGNIATNTYGFVIGGLVGDDTIKDNFTGRPNRDSNLENSNKIYTDTNGLQENVGIYTINVGSIHSKNNNSFKGCDNNFAPNASDCVVVSGVSINNYAIKNDVVSTLTYYLLKNAKRNADTIASKDYASEAVETVVNGTTREENPGTLTITPATLNVTTTANQTKMYGCAYNALNTSNVYNYSYNDGYYTCESGNGTYYDLGYAYTVTGDKDYHIYNYGYYDGNYEAETTYSSNAIKMIYNSNGSVVVDSSMLVNGYVGVGLRQTALNGGTLYRVAFNKLGAGNTINYSSLVTAANAVANMSSYQGQSAGKYVITMGSLDAALTPDYTQTNVCNDLNQPVVGGTSRCKNYIVYYNGDTNSSVSTQHTYSTDDDAATTFIITPRVAFVHTEYNSKVYGNIEPAEKRICDDNMDAAGLCRKQPDVTTVINYGVSYYYTKYNSLAKYPWVSSIESGNGISYASVSGVNDVQTDVINMTNSRLHRYGEDNGESNVDDRVGLYNYKYDSIIRTEYAVNNYELNFYYRELSTVGTRRDIIQVKNGNVNSDTNPLIEDDFGTYKQSQGVNESGGNTTEVDGKEKEIVFEIALRKITVAVINFAKVYGIEDDASYFDLAVCATGDQEIVYDDLGNPKCAFKSGVTSTDHGLSATHKLAFVNNDGTLKQAEFKDEFGVYFLRALGENTGGPISENDAQVVSGTITGKFPDEKTTYAYKLGEKEGVYEVLGVIPQGDPDGNGYNYEISYEIGEMSILARALKVTPEANQGFQYGSYTSGSLIPAIKFTTELGSYNYQDNNMKVISYTDDGKVRILYRDATSADTEIDAISSGLVNGVNGQVCLNNIDGTNSFCINDRQDDYDRDNNENSISSYEANVLGLAQGSDVTTHIFGDNYQNEGGNRSALDREIEGVTGSQRYNRNVARYVITKGDLVDKSGNYRIQFVEDVPYVITPAEVKITPDSNQSKVYGEADKELKFSIVTTYTVNTDQYILNDSSIASITDKDGNNVTIGNANKIKVSKGSVIKLNGYAYYENGNENGSTYNNYGVIKTSNKSASGSAIAQGSVVNGASYDKYCYDNYTDNTQAATGTITGCSDRVIHLESTKQILIGYLYVDGYAQHAGVHAIKNGMVVSDNEFGSKNYDIKEFTNVTFEIKKLDINLSIESITKTYGQSTDAYKCDAGADCTSDYAPLNAQDNEGRLEYNFDIAYKGGEVIQAANSMVLMVNSINGKYYTQSEGAEDKNNYLGVHVIREKGSLCEIATDAFGCEDYDTYALVLRKFAVTNNYDANYNLMYNDENIAASEINNIYVVVDIDANSVSSTETVNVLDVSKVSSTLTINKRSVSIFVNTNVNTSSDNHYQIQQNIEVPKLPEVDNSYNLLGYSYDPNKGYHGVGENASSTSTSPNLADTYGSIVWGGQPTQVRTSDRLIGEVAYYNEPTNGTEYLDTYPYVDQDQDLALTWNLANLVYNDKKATVNTNTKGKFIYIVRDSSSTSGLKIRPDNNNPNENIYEEKNYDVSFHPGAVNVVEDNSAPTLIVGNKDYYIEANAFYNESTNSIVGAYSSLDTVLEFLFNGDSSQRAYIMASVDSDGNLCIGSCAPSSDAITQDSLYKKYGSAATNAYFPGIVSGVEQAGVYPFISDYAHTSGGDETYVNNKNITSLESLISTLITWFNVSSYDKGQIINGEYLERKFDKYYYLVINKHGYDIANNIDNTFAINKVGTYDVAFYVMDNAGRVSENGNVGRLHIIDTTAPDGGELTLYNGLVKCDGECNRKDKWYIGQEEVKLASFNKYNTDDNGLSYYLDARGEYIYFAELGNDTNPYVHIDELREDGLIFTRNNMEYVKIEKKYYAAGIVHYSWTSESGVYLTITGVQDNSYTDINVSKNNQWQAYYSIDNGYYWKDYYSSQEAMIAPAALVTDGRRTIKSMVMDFGNKISESHQSANNYSITYQSCYEGCESIDVPNKVNIDGTVYTFHESDVKNSSFYTDDVNKFTHCVINKANTFATCTTSEPGQPEIKKQYKVLGNKVITDTMTYVIIGDNVYDNTLSFKSKLERKYVEFKLPSSEVVKFRFDESSMMLYRDYVTSSPYVREDRLYFKIGETEYELLGNEVMYAGNKVADLLDGKFTLNGLTYSYVSDVVSSYYAASIGYEVYQDAFSIGGVSYSISSIFGAGNTYTVNGDTLVLNRYTPYHDTYKLYDSKIITLKNTYSDRTKGDTWYEDLAYRQSIASQTGWNRSKLDDGYKDDDRSVTDVNEGEPNSELAIYLSGKDEGNLYYRHSKIAYLDTVAPTIGLKAVGSNGTVKYGEDWYVYEYGYSNLLEISGNSYYLRGITYTIDKTAMTIRGSNGATYDIRNVASPTSDKTYVFTMNYTDYYIDSEWKQIKWLNAYVEKFAGAKDTPAGGNVAPVETDGTYNLNASIVLGGIDESSKELGTLLGETTTRDTSSGIGGSHLPIGSPGTLYDFVYLVTYENCSYYKDVDYVVWYKDEAGITHKFNLSEQFKACYLSDGKIERDCAQAAISEIVKPPEGNKDVTYTINYVVRDKAGNASEFAARGVLFAKIQPNTNVVINQIDAGANNTPVVVSQTDENTYSLVANQGVSLDLLNQAFNVNYSSYYKNYNKSAVMTIYKGDEIIADQVRGVSFTDYIDGSEIADYTVVYNMSSVYVTALGQEVDLQGEEIILNISIGVPILEQETPEVTIESIIENNETSSVLYSLILCFIGFMGVCLVAVLLRKRR